MERSWEMRGMEVVMRPVEMEAEAMTRVRWVVRREERKGGR